MTLARDGDGNVLWDRCGDPAHRDGDDHPPAPFVCSVTGLPLCNPHSDPHKARHKCQLLANPAFRANPKVTS